MKNIRYFLEAVLLYGLFVFFKTLPPKAASNIGGWIGRNIGYRLAASRKAYRHIGKAMPSLTNEQKNKIIRGMWDNLGRVIAEYPHLERISKDCTQIEDLGNLDKHISDNDPIIFIGAHLGNWEINGAATLTQLNHPIALTYRAPNNPWSARLLDKVRTLNHKLTAFPKSQKSGREIIRILKKNGSLGILIDQKYNEGVEANFFGRAVMTNPAFVQLCQKYKCRLIPVRNERIDECNFKLTSYPEINVFNDDGSVRAVMDVINEANALLEIWIRERPEQWLWLHNRWKL